MTDTEEQDLRDLGADIAGAMSSAWEPACLARIFATPSAEALALTLQGWIDLDRARSPLLIGEPLATNEDLFAAAGVFGLAFDEMTPDEVALCAVAMGRAVCD